MTENSLNLLKQLYAIHSPSGKEWKMIQFIRHYIQEHVPETRVEIDCKGNLYITKGSPGEGYPTLCCHLDQVQKKHSADFECRVEGNLIYGYSKSTNGQEGLGADDKNGIWICLECLMRCERLKVFMAVQEEIGLIGAHAARMDFFSDSLYVLEPDTASGYEIHSVLRGIPACSADFLQRIDYTNFNYIDTEGKGTDIYALKHKGLAVSCINIGTAYYRPHKDNEYTILPELDHALQFVLHIVEHVKDRYPHVYQSETQLMLEKSE